MLASPKLCITAVTNDSTSVRELPKDIFFERLKFGFFRATKDLLINYSGLFGDKFNETFAQYGEGDETAYEVLADKSPKELSVLLESDTSLGAAFATAKMITTFNKELI